MNCVVTLSCRNFSAAASRCSHMMARGLAANGCQVDFVVGGSGEYLGRDHEGCDDYRFYSFAASGEKRGSAINHFRMIFSGIIKKRWDMILFYSVGLQFVPLVFLAQRYGIKVVYVQGDRYLRLPGMTIRNRVKLLLLDKIDRYLSRKADLNALVGTTLLAEYFRRHSPKVPILLSYPPIDVELFSKGDDIKFRKQYGLEGKKIIAYCGAVISLEGVEVLVRSMKLVALSNQQAHLVIAGRLGVTDQFLVEQVDYPKLAKDLEISNRVTFTGLIDQCTVRGLLRSADLLIMPKLRHHRNEVAAPIKLSEYFAAGRPVIATTVGDLCVRFQDGEELRLCKPDDVEDLAGKILQMLGNPEISEQIAEKGQIYAMRNFDYRSWGKDVLSLLMKERI